MPGPQREGVCRQQRRAALLVGAGVPGPFPGVSGLKGVALQEEDVAENSRPRGLCRHIQPATFLAGRPTWGEKAQPGFQQPRAGGHSPQPHAALRGWTEAPVPVVTGVPCREVAA